jgi:hypothetical protein
VLRRTALRPRAHACDSHGNGLLLHVEVNAGGVPVLDLISIG